MIHDTHTHRRRLALSLCALLFIAVNTACKDSSVVSDSGKPATAAAPTEAAVTPATAAASPAATPAAVGTATPATATAMPAPAAPVPSATTTMTTANASILANNPNAGKRPEAAQKDGAAAPRRIGDFPIEVGPARIPTPQPDPFKPRPTPTVVMEGGKIKQQWAAPAEAAATANPAKGRADVVKLGQELYLQRCSDCHGRSGKGNGYMSAQLKRDGQPIAPTNLTSQMVQANTDGELFWKITNGRSPMPASRQRFSDDERWAIVAYLRTLK